MKWRAEWSGGADDERQLKNKRFPAPIFLNFLGGFAL